MQVTIGAGMDGVLSVEAMAREDLVQQVPDPSSPSSAISFVRFSQLHRKHRCCSAGFPHSVRAPPVCRHGMS